MLAKFHLNYKALWGQTVYLLIYKDEETFENIEMTCIGEDKWTVEIKLDVHTEYLQYRYGVKQNGIIAHFEFDGKRKQKLPSNTTTINFRDYWRRPNGDSPFGTIAFNEVFFKRKKKARLKKTSNTNLTLQLRCPQIEPDRHFAVIGNQQALGNWDVSKKVRLDENEFPIWSISLNTKDLKFPLEYKYLIVETKTDEILAWGGGANRKLKEVDEKNFTVVTDENFIRTIPSWKTTGVSIPVFSLRSEASFGTGDFMDLKKMVDWAKMTGQNFIQILPINDTILYHSNYDSYPYNAVSVYALHPNYLRLEKMGTLSKKRDIAYFEKKKKELNENDFSDYQNVLTEKWKYFQLIYNQTGQTVFQSEEYAIFFENNRDWLVPYAVFSYLRDKNGTPEFGKWTEHQIYKKEEIEKLAAADSMVYKEIAFFYFLQYHLHVQLTEVRDYAHSKGVALKNDVPIGVSPRSVDAWTEPTLFNTQMQAGAPPDDFSVTGQNWGFPTYNWDEMVKDDYAWWKKRFRKFVEYFDAYRIDHILGFFRIWEIPGNAVWALTGSFNPALPYSIADLQSRGLWWDENRFLKPYLKEHVIRAIFGKFADDVMREYLVIDGWQNFRFKTEFDTQKKVEAHFASLGYNFTNKELQIRDGLYALHCEVLFVRDKNKPAMVHPRIAMHSSHTFRDLDDATRRVMDKIYVEYFYHRHNDFWKEQAMKKLPAIISATNMLVCGEDLGMVPETVPEVMHRLELLSLEIQRMPKKPNTEFAMPAEAPYLSVCTTSTHDMNPLRAWWEEDETIRQRFYNHALRLQGSAPDNLSPLLAEKIINQHLQSDAMLVILPWQDWISMEKKLWRKNPNAERINIPADPRNFWCYRMHLTLEQLLVEKKFNAKVKKMIKESGR
ncbi:MAG: 4-alpha-glucanotransferase [Paludibacteraceae bacterium]